MRRSKPAVGRAKSIRWVVTIDTCCVHIHNCGTHTYTYNGWIHTSLHILTFVHKYTFVVQIQQYTTGSNRLTRRVQFNQLGANVFLFVQMWQDTILVADPCSRQLQTCLASTDNPTLYGQHCQHRTIQVNTYTNTLVVHIHSTKYRYTNTYTHYIVPGTLYCIVEGQIVVSEYIRLITIILDLPSEYD